MRRAAVVVLVAAAIVAGSAAGAAANDTGDAFAVVKTVIGQLARGDAADAWSALVPSQQAIVSQAAYEACRAQSGLLDLRSVQLVAARKVRYKVAGTRTSVPAMELDVKVTLTSRQHETIRTHTVKVGATWRYTLAQAEVTRCAAPTTPTS
jgi:hypothetical protein